jgi:hypothetical protein
MADREDILANFQVNEENARQRKRMTRSFAKNERQRLIFDFSRFLSANNSD